MNKIAPGYYKTQESGLIRVLYEAIHAEIGDVFVVYQRLNISTQVLTISKAQFISKFSLVKADCCIEDIPLCLNPKYFFPDIHYDANLSELVDGATFTKSVKSMITLLVKREIISVDLIKNCEKDDDIELIIRERINTYTSGESLEEVFHLIQLF